MQNNTNEIVNFLNLIQQGYVISDERDEDDFVVLVDENSEVLRDFRPSKEFIQSLEQTDYVTIVEKEKKREYFNSRGKRKPMPLITIYKITDKGLDLLKQK